MRFGKIDSKKLLGLLKVCLIFILLFYCVGFADCQTAENRYELQLHKCIEQSHQDTKEGVGCLENLLSSNPDKKTTYLFLARDYRELNELEQAGKAIDSFLVSYKNDASGYETKCEILRDKKAFQEALQACATSMRLEPDNISHKQQTVASVYEAEGDFERAEFWYKQILAANSEDQSALVSLGRLYEKSGNLDSAIETYEKLLKLDFEFKDKLQEGIKKLKNKKEELNKKNIENTQKPKKVGTKNSLLEESDAFYKSRK